MKIRLKFILCMASLFGYSFGVQADELDDQIADTIKTACHGYLIEMLPDILDPISEYLHENSPICDDVTDESSQEEILESYKTFISTYNVSMPIGPPESLSNPIEMECENWKECSDIRKQLAADNIPMSQAEYDQLADYCEGEPSEVSCIQEWVQDNWIDKGIREIPGRAGFDFDDLITTRTENVEMPAPSGLNFDDLVVSRTTNSPITQNDEIIDFAERPLSRSAAGVEEVQAQLDLDSIFESRALVRLNAQKETLFQMGEQIASSCQCALQNNFCYEANNYLYDSLTTAVSEQAILFSDNKLQVCNAWLTNLRGLTADDSQTIEAYIAASNTVLNNLNQLDGGYQTMLAQMSLEESRITDEIRRREAEQRWIAEQQEAEQNGVSFGQVFAIAAVGLAVAGSDLPVDQAADLFQSITSDILSDSGTASNTLSLMESFGYSSIDLEPMDFNQLTLETMNEIEAFQQDNSGLLVSNSGGFDFEQIAQDEEFGPVPSGRFGAVMYSYEPSDYSVGMALSKSSQNEALQAARSDCGSTCAAQQIFSACAAVVIGRQSEAPGKYIWVEEASSRIQAENVAMGACDFQARGFSGSNTLSCRVEVSGCN